MTIAFCRSYRKKIKVGSFFPSFKSCKAPVKSSPPTNQHPVQITGRMPFLSPSQQCQSTEGKFSHVRCY